VAGFVVFNEGALLALLQGSDGGVARDLVQRAVRVESQAKVNASGGPPGPNVRTGRLRSSITHQVARDSQGLYADIGSNVEYAAYVELGTRFMHPRPYLRPALEAAR
jgi:phage gpG-like protein